MYQPIYPQKKQKLSWLDRDFLVSLGVIALCLFFSLVFPTQNSAQKITANLFFLILLPVAYTKIILQKKLADFGWNLKNKSIGLIWGIGTFFFTLLLFYLMLNYTDFNTVYVLPNYIKNNFWLFLFYELFIVNLSIFIFSYFFQGFILSLFQKKIASLAISAQTSLFLATLFLTNAFSWQSAPFILLSVTAGFLAYKTKSFFYSYFMSIFAIIILDSYIIYLTR
jgi:hypothetical protein